MHPEIHHDIVHHITQNWDAIVDAMIPDDSIVASYSFPIPVNSRTPGRLGYLRSGRMIYEFISMTDADIASVAYRFTHLVKADIKNFYPAIYTHSLSWALHGKAYIRIPANMHNFGLLGNLLDKLFQNANDGCTNGLPIGPVVSDVAAEIMASAVDRQFTKLIKAKGINCEAIRFKDDYRILVTNEADAKAVVKYLQTALKEYNLELSDDKTKVTLLPDGLFREWVSMYHAVHPEKRTAFTWKQFRELYLAVINIDRACPNTGCVDRFLADITTEDGALKVPLDAANLGKAISMLLMLATLRVKAFPKIIAIIEGVVRSPFGIAHRDEIVQYLEEYLSKLALEESRNKYLITWISYFLVSNNLVGLLSYKPQFKDPITRSIISNRSLMFKDCADFKIFEGCRSAGKRVSMFQHLDVFNPPHT
jgi:hypothetical protein